MLAPCTLRHLHRSMLAVALAIGSQACHPSPAQEADSARGSLSLSELLTATDGEAFATAQDPPSLEFPEDHGAHPEFRSEWWYLTGNLSTAAGRRFGYQFTLFRQAVAAETTERESSWATSQIYMGHLALTDVEDRAFHCFERFSRGAVGLAGVTSRPFRAWLEDWQLTGDSPPPFGLEAAEGGIGLELGLASAKPVVLQGDRGLSRKGRQPGNASYYYSYTRMPTRGLVTIGHRSFEVQGSSWLDREWSTSALEEGQIGWDWFSVQLSDGRDLMVYRLRRKDGTSDPSSSGTLVAIDGSTRSLDSSEFSIEPRGWWTSPGTGVRYPSGWRLSLPSAALDLTLTPLLDNQELALSLVYWEGAVAVEGVSHGDAVSGHGYVELTGYDSEPRAAHRR